MLSPKGRNGLSLLALVSLALAGCGGNYHRHDASTPAANTAALKMTMAWPVVSNKMVPNSANSVVAVVTLGGKEIARGMFVRSTAERGLGAGASSTITLQGLPEGVATVTMTAYPNLDGTGTVQAKGSASETLVAGQTTNDTTTMASTVKTLVLAPTTLSMPAGDGGGLNLSARDGSGAIVMLSTSHTEDLTWTSSNESAATVASGNFADAFVQSTTEGTTTIEVSMVVDDAGTKKRASVPVTVTAPVVRSIAITGGETMTAGGTDPLTAVGTFSDGSHRGVTSEVAWSVSPNTGGVDPQGVFTASVAGTYNATATLNGVSKAFTITVSAARTLQSITISPSNHYSFNPQDVQFAAMATYSDNTQQDVTAAVTWSNTPPQHGAASISGSGLFHWTSTPYWQDGSYVSASLNGVQSSQAFVWYDND